MREGAEPHFPLRYVVFHRRSSSAATGAGVGTTTQPAKDPSSGTGGDNVTTKTARVTIVIHQPKP